ncbi:MAG TPA: acyltransferase [Clostridia bacterium]|nr:acyltransferase [Clostridia bacterium]
MLDSSSTVGNTTAEIPSGAAILTVTHAKTSEGTLRTQSPADRSLDQWRGLALLLVLISHGFFHTGRVPGVGRAGVNLFFFISGILVFRSLSRGPQDSVIGSRYFWVRRIKRLVPAKYFYLLCMTLLVVVAPLAPITADFRRSFLDSLPSAFLYYLNYYSPLDLGVRENLAGHLWSLACEMQFYILAPLIFFAGGKTTARRLAVFGAILAVFLIGGLSVIGKARYDPYTFGVAAWPMMAGFFAEFLRSTFPKQCTPWGKLLVWCGMISLIAFIPALILASKKGVILAGTLLVAGCFGCYLRGIAPQGLLGNAFHFLGNRTYSIYLWQQPLTIGGIVPQVLHPLGSLLAIPIGALSFRFFERPFMSKYKVKEQPPQVA